MEQRLGFCTTSDGVSIAYATIGEGPPLVYATGWPGHLALEWETPVARLLLEELAVGVTLIRYDMRGTGLSDHRVPNLSLERWVEDLAAVVDHLKLERFSLLSLGFLAGPIAMTYAAAHPERVDRIILSNAYLRGSELTTPERARALIEYVSSFGFPISIQSATEPGDFERYQEVGRIQEQAARPQVQGAVTEAILSADVSELVAELPMPALVLHGRHDQSIPFAQGRELAARLPNARFVPFEESAAAPWQRQDIIVRELRRFLEIGQAEEGAEAASAGAPVAILFTDMDSSTALTQRLGDGKAQVLVRTHNSIVREALKAHNGSEIKHTGDGIMASLPSAGRALECAIAIQRAVMDCGAPDLHVHIGVNAGEPVAEDRDLFGTAVQLARRICDKAESGEILVSNVVRELAAGKGFLFADRGETALRGFEDPVRLFEVRWLDGG